MAAGRDPGQNGSMDRTLERQGRRWIGVIARLGFATKGLVYVLVGGLAVLLATGQGGRATDETGAMRTVGELPYGSVLLVGAAIGLAAYGLWRLFEAATNPLGVSGAKGVAQRLGYAVAGGVHLVLASVTARLAQGDTTADGPSKTRGVAWLMGEPGGRVVLALVALGLIGHGIFQLICAATSRLPPELEPAGPDGQRAGWLVTLGRVGLGARGFVFSLIGARVLVAAWRARPGATRDLGGVLGDLGNQAYGAILLGVVAAGLAAYGVFMITCARYGRIAGDAR